jgi:hypothetical protein
MYAVMGQASYAGEVKMTLAVAQAFGFAGRNGRWLLRIHQRCDMN